jgi:Zn-dependent M28 family amino/carboxypeptidase
MILMPGRSFRGPLPPLSEAEQQLAARLQADLQHLGGDLGDRNILFRPTQLREAAGWIEASFREAGLEVTRQDYEVTRQDLRIEGATCTNLVAELPGTTHPEQILVVGAHYDSVSGCPAANDNGTGVVALLALGRALAGTGHPRTLRLVAFANEEPPWFQTRHMGSLVYARSCEASGDQIFGMLSLETMGCYSDDKGSQQYPVPGLGLLYGTRGNFIAFVGNVGSSKLIRRVVGTFRRRAAFPSQGAALPASIPGVGWSDHWSFWQAGYRALEVTDTAPYRYAHYHKVTDTPDKVDHERLARVTLGLQHVVEVLLEKGL